MLPSCKGELRFHRFMMGKYSRAAFSVPDGRPSVDDSDGDRDFTYSGGWTFLAFPRQRILKSQMFSFAPRFCLLAGLDTWTSTNMLGENKQTELTYCNDTILAPRGAVMTQNTSKLFHITVQR